MITESEHIILTRVLWLRPCRSSSSRSELPRTCSRSRQSVVTRTLFPQDKPSLQPSSKKQELSSPLHTSRFKPHFIFPSHANGSVLGNSQVVNHRASVQPLVKFGVHPLDIYSIIIVHHVVRNHKLSNTRGVLVSFTLRLVIIIVWFIIESTQVVYYVRRSCWMNYHILMISLPGGSVGHDPLW